MLKAPLVATGVLRQIPHRNPRNGGYTILLYHRVHGSLPLELDLEPEMFERQLAWLAANECLIGYGEALNRLQQGTNAPGSACVLTFDDAYSDFYTRVYPLLQEYSIPATLFVTTGFVEEGKPYPMLSNPGADVEPVSWEMLGEMSESGLITLGAHTHTHPVLSGLPSAQVEEELAQPLALFQRRLGIRPLHFAYPRGVASANVRKQVARYYESAVVGGGSRAMIEGFDRYRIPRIPIRRSDGWLFFRAKMHGWLQAEEPMYARLRMLAGRGET